MSVSSEAVKRWRRRTKERIVEAMGGSCVICGYSRCVEALDLHHLDPYEKEVSLSSIRANPRSWDRIVIELRKCVLLCAICHREHHAGLFEIPSETASFDEKFIEYQPLVHAACEPCPVCTKDKPVHLKTCSLNCAAKYRYRVNWDGLDLLNLIDEHGSMEAVGRHLGCSGAAVRKRLSKKIFLSPVSSVERKPRERCFAEAEVASSSLARGTILLDDSPQSSYYPLAASSGVTLTNG